MVWRRVWATWRRLWKEDEITSVDALQAASWAKSTMGTYCTHYRKLALWVGYTPVAELETEACKSLGMPCTQCACSAHTVRSFECRPILRPYFWPLLTSFWFHMGFFFSLQCIWDVAHLNCHPLSPNVNHFYPFFIPHIELSPLWGPREGRGDVAIHSPRTLRSLWFGLHPHHIKDLARHQQVCHVHTQNHHRPPLHPIRGERRNCLQLGTPLSL